MINRVGAPPGLYVHWLADELIGEFTKEYGLNIDPKKHNYRYSRYNKKTLVDEFIIIIRTSKRCYRVMYYNAPFKFFYYFSAKGYKQCAEKMKAIYKIFKSLECKLK